MAKTGYSQPYSYPFFDHISISDLNGKSLIMRDVPLSESAADFMRRVGKEKGIDPEEFSPLYSRKKLDVNSSKPQLSPCVMTLKLFMPNF